METHGYQWMYKTVHRRLLVSLVWTVSVSMVYEVVAVLPLGRARLMALHDNGRAFLY